MQPSPFHPNPVLDTYKMVRRAPPLRVRFQHLHPGQWPAAPPFPAHPPSVVFHQPSAPPSQSLHRAYPAPPPPYSLHPLPPNPRSHTPLPCIFIPMLCPPLRYELPPILFGDSAIPSPCRSPLPLHSQARIIRHHMFPPIPHILHIRPPAPPFLGHPLRCNMLYRPLLAHPFPPLSSVSILFSGIRRRFHSFRHLGSATPVSQTSLYHVPTTLSSPSQCLSTHRAAKLARGSLRPPLSESFPTHSRCSSRNPHTTFYRPQPLLPLQTTPSSFRLHLS